MQVFLPPEGLTNLGEASPSQDNVFCAQLQRFQIKNMNERGLHSWHAENCYKKFPFLCKRRACTPRGTPSAQLRTWTWIVDRCSSSCFPRRSDVRGHQGQRGERGLLLHAEGRRPVSELHVSRRRAGDVRGGAVRAAAGLPALPQGPQGVLQVHLPRPRYPAVGTGSTSRSLARFPSFSLSQPVLFSSVAADGNSLFDSMASGMRLIVSCISSFLILSLLLFMVHRLRQRRRERIETLIGGNCESEFFCNSSYLLGKHAKQTLPKKKISLPLTTENNVLLPPGGWEGP